MIGTFALLLKMKGKKKIMGFVLFNRIKLVIKVNYYLYITIKIKLGKNFHEIDLKKSKMQSIEFFKQNVLFFSAGSEIEKVDIVMHKKNNNILINFNFSTLCIAK
jgi:hypothetical protein